MRQFFSFFFACFVATAGFSQDDNTKLTSAKAISVKKADSLVFGKAQLDFAVPDIPAFKALGVDPSSILRPSSPKQFSLMFSNLASSGFSAIPRNAAVEIAPALITNTWYTQDQYRSRPALRLLTKTRLSLGTNQDEATGVNTIAFGLRTTAFDKGDFRMDAQFQRDSIYSKIDAFHNNIAARLENVKIIYGIRQYIALPQAKREQIIDSLQLIARAETGDVDEIIDAAIENYKKLNWNASRLDFAYSMLLQSPDSLIGNVQMNKHLLWATIALRPGKNNHWAQLLIGTNLSTYRMQDDWYTEFTGNLRFYAGANRIKGLFELQYQDIDRPVGSRTRTLFTQLGVEASLFRGIWLQFSTGIINALEGNNRSALKGNLNVSLTLPENFRLF